MKTYNLEVIQESDYGDELNTWYVYDHDSQEVLNNEWFETEKEAQDYLDWFLFQYGNDDDNGMTRQYSNENPPWKNKDWKYGQYNHIMQRFKAMGFVPPSEKRAKE